jgi:hypothetical protein
MQLDPNIIVPTVVTALVTTLVVEYFAKPRLEARKERILRQLRSREDLVAAVIDIAGVAEYVAIDVPKDGPAEARQNLIADRSRAYERLQKLVAGLHENMGRHAGSYRWPYLGIVIAYIGYLKGAVLSVRTQAAQGRMIREVSGHLVAILAPDPVWKVWRWPHRFRALNAVYTILEIPLPFTGKPLQDGTPQVAAE